MAKSKVKRYANEGYVYEDDTPEEVANRSENAQSIMNEAKGDTMLKAMRDEAAKPKMVTKEELAKSGLSLRDYMNKQQGLSRRGESTSKSAPDTGDETSRLAARMPKPQLKYQSLQDRENEAEAKRRAEGRTFYGTNKMKMSEREERKPLPLKSTKFETGYTGMGSLKFSKGGSAASKRADGIAMRGHTKGKYL
jgi:hypothetical protein